MSCSIQEEKFLNIKTEDHYLGYCNIQLDVSERMDDKTKRKVINDLCIEYREFLEKALFA
jgi:hypothetical protein